MNSVLSHITFWCLYVIFTVAIYYVQEPNLGVHIVYELASLPAKLFCVYITLGLIVPRLLLKGYYWQAAFQVGLILIVGVLLLRIFVINSVYPLYFPDIENTFIPDDLSKVVSPLLDLIIVTAIAVVIKLLKNREKEEINRLGWEKSNVQNELQLLKSQLHPHFLFNTLNGMYAQILNNPEIAADMVIKLSDLLRFIIYEARKELVIVSDDLECIKNYIALERIRYGSKLQLTFAVKGVIVNKKIPPLLLLPFIENSFKHGIANGNTMCWINCQIYLSGDMLELDLQNSIESYPETENETVGIGILNVKQRLKYNYQERFSLTTNKSEDRYHVNMKIPIVKL